ncbi:E3 ubiquitin/ISG15 ligase TRIM25-like [Protopterus annectens]|uniref:E3 ubiquitin/ISG15 ligase TRIM25-like n=1 Tax=Protopterus annectens TaxID=7888 RepID=UPI001CFB2289|nr:E3 ubiquitin/ISG15 ligase TRIM25-like [Protopterus annectens]
MGTRVSKPEKMSIGADGEDPGGSDDTLRCPFCANIFHFPITLQCDHKFCLKCVGKFWDTNEDPHCPRCRKKCTDMKFSVNPKPEKMSIGVDGEDPSYSDDTLRCPLCANIFQVPVMLECGHNFCLKCVGKFWDSNEDSYCPRCKKKCPDMKCPADPKLERMLIDVDGEDPSYSDDTLRCPFCANIFQIPVMLECGHNFCLKCVGKFWDTDEDPHCPRCKKKCPDMKFSLNPIMREAVLLHYLKHTPSQYSESSHLLLCELSCDLEATTRHSSNLFTCNFVLGVHCVFVA